MGKRNGRKRRFPARAVRERSAGPTLAYALRHGHVHLAEVATNAGPEGEAVLREWFDTFLEPRGAEQSAAASGEASESREPEPELEGRAGHSYALSPWRARALAAAWLERQAAHGRSKQLVPELLPLEAALSARAGEEHEQDGGWLRGLWQLMQNMRWGIGEFWAPHYDTDPSTARSTLAANISATSPLHDSAAMRALGLHRLCLPPRIAISPTIHQLLADPQV